MELMNIYTMTSQKLPTMIKDEDGHTHIKPLKVKHCEYWKRKYEKTEYQF
jgi:hypothetical protein